MKAEARALTKGYVDHEVADEAHLAVLEPQPDGSVEVAFLTQKVDIHLHGGYRMTLRFSAAEVAEMHRQSYAGSAKGAIEGAKPKPQHRLVLRRL